MFGDDSWWKRGQRFTFLWPLAFGLICGGVVRVDRARFCGTETSCFSKLAQLAFNEVRLWAQVLILVLEPHLKITSFMPPAGRLQ